MRPQVETSSGLSAVLRGVVANMQHASGADIVSIFLYEESTHFELLARGEWTSYAVGTRPAFEAGAKQPEQQAIGTKS